MPLGPDGSYAGKVYTKQQPGGGTLNGTVIQTEQVIDAGGLLNNYGLSAVAGVVQPASVSITPAAGAANQSLVTVQVKDGAGQPIARVFELMVYLSDSPAGAGLTGTTASGAVQAGASGTDLQTKVSKKALDVLTDASGKYVLAITDTAKTGFYVCSTCPGTDNVQVSSQLQTASYG